MYACMCVCVYVCVYCSVCVHSRAYVPICNYHLSFSSLVPVPSPMYEPKQLHLPPQRIPAGAACDYWFMLYIVCVSVNDVHLPRC